MYPQPDDHRLAGSTVQRDVEISALTKAPHHRWTVIDTPACVGTPEISITTDASPSGRSGRVTLNWTNPLPVRPAKATSAAMPQIRTVIGFARTAACVTTWLAGKGGLAGPKPVPERRMVSCGWAGRVSAPGRRLGFPTYTPSAWTAAAYVERNVKSAGANSRWSAVAELLLPAEFDTCTGTGPTVGSSGARTLIWVGLT